MNHFYRVVFNQALGTMQAVSENSRTKGKGGRCKRPSAKRALKTAASASALAAVFFIQPAKASVATINSNDTVTINGDNTGTYSSPWKITGDLIIGDTLGDGTLTIENGGKVTVDAIVLGQDSPATGYLNIHGTDGARGILTTSSITQGSGSGILSFSGGILQANADNNDFLHNISSVNVGNDAYIDTNDHNIGISASLQGSGGLIKQGAGTLTLSSTNSYVGGTQLLGGIINVSSNNNLGEDGRDLTFDSGTLQIAASSFDTVNRNITLEAGGGHIDSLDGANFVFTRTISGPGILYKQGLGAITLSGANTYQGGTQLLSGVIKVSSDANLGNAAGGLTFDGGELRITDSSYSSTSRNLTLNAGGGTLSMDFNSTSGEVVTVAGNITGNGDLHKTGRGNLRLTGDNAYGNTYIDYGELIGSSHSISGNVILGEDASVTFNEPSASQFAGNISDTPNLEAQAIKDGAGSLTLTGNSSVNWLIDAGELITSAQRFQGDANINTNGIMTFNETGDTTLAGAIQGSGHLNKTGSGVLRITNDSSAFTGSTTISGGTLSVGNDSGAGSLGGTLAVASGGTLGGGGQVGTTTVQAGGTVAPGNSIGTLTVNGNLTFAPGSVYAVEVNPQGTDSDQIKVTGSAALNGGSVVHIGQNGNYAPQSSYRILTAGTGLSGTFDGVTSNFAFLTPSLAYDYANYTVNLNLSRNNSSFASTANTPNQVATANALSSLPSSNALYQRILGLPNGAPPATFDSLSGEVHASVLSALQADSDIVRSLPFSHLRGNLSAGLKPGAPIAQAGAGALPAGSLPQSAAQPLWAEVVGSWRNMDGDGNAASLNQSMGGLFVGGDYSVGAGWRIGAALGYTEATLNVDDRNSKANVDTTSATLYGGKAIDIGNGKLNMLLGGAYSWHDITSTRYTNVAGSNEKLKADYRANTNQLFGELGYAMAMGTFTLEPFAGLAWSDVHTRGFTESGGSTALSGSSQSQSTTSSTLGLRANTAFTLGRTQGRLYGTLGWRHAFGNTAPQSTLAFANSQPFTVAGVPLARNTALLELGASIAVSPNATISASYSGQLGNGTHENTGKIYAQWKF